jgi:hypothetical protein
VLQLLAAVHDALQALETPRDLNTHAHAIGVEVRANAAIVCKLWRSRWQSSVVYVIIKAVAYERVEYFKEQF